MKFPLIYRASRYIFFLASKGGNELLQAYQYKNLSDRKTEKGNEIQTGAVGRGGRMLQLQLAKHIMELTPGGDFVYPVHKNPKGTQRCPMQANLAKSSRSEELFR